MAFILIIEDQVFHQEFLKDILLEEGHEISAVNEGSEALRIAAEKPVDLALVDIFLKGENGLEICRQLSKRQPDTPIIIMTASPSLELAVQSIRQGAYDFLVKPLNHDMVLIAVRRALERKNLIDEKNFLISQLMDSNRILKSFQQITLETISARRPRTVLGKAVKGLIEVTGSSGGAVLFKSKNLKLPFPYMSEYLSDRHGPSVSDLEALFQNFIHGPKHFILPSTSSETVPPELQYEKPLMALKFNLDDDSTGGIVLWKDNSNNKFQQVDLSIASAILRTLNYLLNASLRQRILQTANKRLKRRIEHSSEKVEEIRSRLETLVFEVEKEKTRSSEALQRLEIINRIGHELGSFVDISSHIRKVMSLCMEALQAKIISLLLLDEEKDSLYIKYAIGLPDNVIAKTKVAPGEGISGWVFKNNTPLLIKDVETDDRFHRVSHGQYETASLISAPVRSKEKPIGVLNVNNKIDGSLFNLQDLDLLVFVSHEVGVAIENTNLYEDIQNSYFETIRTLVKVLEAKDEATKGHSERVTEYCLAIGNEMGLSHQSLEILERAGILHDLGKVAVDISILRKEGKLTEEEFNAIQKHPLIAAEIIHPMKYMEEVQKCIQQHHERHDGHGYPLGIKKISLEAKILAVADAYDAMTSWRPYRKPMTCEKAIIELQNCAGSQFDPEVVKILVRLLRTKY